MSTDRVVEYDNAAISKLFSDVIVLTDPNTDRKYPFPIDSKINEYWNDIWEQTNRDCKLIYSTEIQGIPYRVFVRSSGDSDQIRKMLPIPHVP
jgi:hypothetical protein